MSKLGHMDKNTTEAWFSSLQDAAERINLHPRTLRRAIDAGDLPAYKFGSALRVRLDDLDAWAESKAIPNPRTTRPTLSGGASL